VNPLTRGRFYGFYLSGRRRGTVQESPHRVFVTAELPRYAETVSTTSGGMWSVMNPAVDRMNWYHQMLEIGGRTYGVWLDHPLIMEGDFTEAILTLIDMDPMQARLCEVSRG
jgi:hypothetical protein